MLTRLRHQPRPDPRGARRPRRAGGDREARTIPGEVAREAIEPTLFGFPAEFGDDETEQRAEPDDVLPSEPELVVVRRADLVGGSVLVLAGVAANVSLALSWSPGDGIDGLSLVEQGVRAVGAGGPGLSTSWQPLVVVLSGGVLVLLGLLLLVPARSHRLVGVLALFASLAAAAAVAVLTAGLGWRPDRFGPGMWCAVAVPILGLLGSLKAMLTAPLVTLDSR